MSDHMASYEILVAHLQDLNYNFICPSPETQERVVRKRALSPATANGRTAIDFFGWNLPIDSKTLKSIIPDSLIAALLKYSLISQIGGNRYRSTIRVSNFYLPNVPKKDDNTKLLYYVHSSYPASSDSVFFGPDTYLFISFLEAACRHLQEPPESIIDVCCGSGAGAIHLARVYPQAKAFGLDLNPHALRLGSVNAHLAETTVEFRESDLYLAVQNDDKSDGVNLIVSNPPYIASSKDGKDLPIYADGGAKFGLDISLRIVEQGKDLLSSNGIIIVYTGVAIPVAEPGHDAFLEMLQRVAGTELIEYTILHPDMWPEEIGQGAYADVGRIQVVGAVLRKR